ncbi:MAG: tRNA (adenosine(37)-N6)-threonylcarbamoyltransferase complex ATPase subunit type 1 TsaE [Phaeodactylibacter sp.]|nr:tRNA (adenosine(37)-N6)-threonylcarbamoyltransferase complex ATPase subunit type 1 TsaE [Phaeodactylibacter sp.]
MKQVEFLAADLTVLPEIAKQILALLGEQRIVLFEGEIGAGKTTLIKSLCQLLGMEESVTSPTFSIVNEYKAGASIIYHIDLYRLKELEEALEIGIEEYLDSGHYCFIEWPDLIEPLLEPPSPRISIDIMADSSRKILFLYDSASDNLQI